MRARDLAVEPGPLFAFGTPAPSRLVALAGAEPIGEVLPFDQVSDRRPQVGHLCFEFSDPLGLVHRLLRPPQETAAERGAGEEPDHDPGDEDPGDRDEDDAEETGEEIAHHYIFSVGGCASTPMGQTRHRIERRKGEWNWWIVRNIAVEPQGPFHCPFPAEALPRVAPVEVEESVTV